MSGADDAEEAEVSSQALPDLLADLNASSTSSDTRHSVGQAALWSFSSVSLRASPPLFGARPLLQLPQRASVREPQSSLLELDISSPLQPTSLFSTPSRSIFTTGLPTSSVSASTAQASMSSPPPSTSLNPLSALSTANPSASRRSSQPQSVPQASATRKPRVVRVEKDVDDPSGSMKDSPSASRRSADTSNTLSKLFTAPEPTSPGISRHASYIRTASGSQYTRSTSAETAPLPEHLYSRGLLSGRHSDITVHAFGTKYALHRLLLDRAPFFRSALSEPWFESSSKEITLHPEEIDSNITQNAFELALKRIYGCERGEEEDKEAIGLFATGCWLEMADLIEASITSILRQMSPSKLTTFIRFVTSNYYGKAGDRILAAAKAMLCREGWEMPLSYWDGIPGDIAREIVGGDGFYVTGEWERWLLAKRLVNRRIKAQATELGLLNAQGKILRARPDSTNFMAVRSDTVYRKTSVIGGRETPEGYDSWLAVYTSPEVAPLLVLLDEGIHYVHLSFEQLQKIKQQRDVFGLPLLPEKVISDALWMSMELRQRILNAKDLDLELGLSQHIDDTNEADISNPLDAQRGDSAPEFDLLGCSHPAGKKVDRKPEETEDDMESSSWDGNGKPRKFWIPQTDATYPMGGTIETVLPAPSTGRSPANRQMTRLSTLLDPHDVQWAADFVSTVQDRSETPTLTIPAVSNVPSPHISYTHYPPFRFAAEFPSARALRENKRVYSSTVWYAGSLWNVYVQKKETSKHTQLGIYLHRERHVEGSENMISNMTNPNVDERIGRLEREIIMRGPGGSISRRQAHRQAYRQVAMEIINAEDNNSGSGEDQDPTLVAGPSAESDSRRHATTLSGLLRNHTQSTMKDSEASLSLSSMPERKIGSRTPDTDDELDNAGKKLTVSALTPYVDGRPTIKTYFKIYTPSKGGRVLSVYESAPDQFNFSQSWGWKSSNLILDDGVSVVDEGSGVRNKDAKLRFMVVIGNV